MNQVNDFKLEDLKDLSIEDIKNLELEDFLVYIQEFDNKKSQIFIINLFKIVKQLANKQYENANLSQIRNDFYDTKDLRKRVNIIHEFITQKTINIANDENELNNELIKIDQKIDILEYYTLEEAKKNIGENTPRFKQFRRDTFIPLQLRITKIFNQVRSAFVEDQYQRREKEEYQEKLLQLYDASIEAAKKYGIKVNHSLGTTLEQGFEKASEGAGLEIKKHAEINKKRVIEAKTEMKTNELMKIIKKELMEKGEISPELQKKLNKIRAGEN